MNALEAMPGEHRERLRTAGAVHESIKSQVHASISESLQEQTAKLLAAIQEDVESDKEIVVEIRDLTRAIRELVMALSHELR